MSVFVKGERKWLTWQDFNRQMWHYPVSLSQPVGISPITTVSFCTDLYFFVNSDCLLWCYGAFIFLTDFLLTHPSTSKIWTTKTENPYDCRSYYHNLQDAYTYMMQNVKRLCKTFIYLSKMHFISSKPIL